MRDKTRQDQTQTVSFKHSISSLAQIASSALADCKLSRGSWRCQSVCPTFFRSMVHLTSEKTRKWSQMWQRGLVMHPAENCTFQWFTNKTSIDLHKFLSFLLRLVDIELLPFQIELHSFRICYFTTHNCYYWDQSSEHAPVDAVSLHI